jgi:hypothetical protein
MGTGGPVVPHVNNANAFQHDETLIVRIKSEFALKNGADSASLTNKYGKVLDRGHG